MTEDEKQEFWASLGRLYDASRANYDATVELRKIAESHEKRLDKVEVTIEALREVIRDTNKNVEKLSGKIDQLVEAMLGQRRNGPE
jgi:hypothetical protein